MLARLQLALLSTSQQEQYSRNRSVLEARLARILEELESEIAQIRGRYADVQFRLFSIAVTFLVP